MFTMECECGAKLKVEEKEGRCRACGTRYTIIWPDPDVKPGSEPRTPLTISDQYDEANRAGGDGLGKGKRT